ncbi:O-antigen ligase family protein (plasmid) [Tundrisphaera sp. TA3]|uniref:O-antigen ligase family protein n=1 Tax=Tundrisphaera sp. TA3 TaxID=3435775 RepID=UPI003EBBB1A4
MPRRCRLINEWILVALACLPAWAYGAVAARAELGLYLGIALSSLLGAASGWNIDRRRALACLPSLALIALIALAFAQTWGWPGRLMAAPGRDEPGRVLGDPGPPIAPHGPAISRNPELTVDAATRLVAGWVLFQTVLGAGLGPGALRRLGAALAANAALMALFAAVQMLSWNGRMFWTLAPLAETARGGPFVNRNHLAAYLNLGLGFPLAALLAPGAGRDRPEDRGRRLAAAYAAGLIAVGVLGSLSRGGFAAMAVATASLLAMARPRMARAVGGMAATLALVAAFLWDAGASDPFRRIASLTEPGAYEARAECWEGAWRAWSSGPILGAGLGTFAWSAARSFVHDRPVAFMHAENEYLEVLVESGIIGLLLVVLLAGSVMRLGLVAARAAPDPRRKGAILGALFGMVALATHGLVDFPTHIPAIAVAAAILAAHLARSGLDVRGEVPEVAGPWPGRVALASAPVALGLLAACHGVAMARSEAALAGCGIPPAGTDVPTATLWNAPMPMLERAQGCLAEALAHRPDWAEGHARLGLLLLSRYRAEAAGLVGEQVGDPRRASMMADPLWLHGAVHAMSPDEAGEVPDYGPVRRYLVPAARSFLEARRCCPAWGLPHAELASLDYLISGGGTATDHARRALELCATDFPTIQLAATAASQAGDPRTAALGWRMMLRARDDRWATVADQAGAALSPRQIMDWVLPDGRQALRFADRLYGSTEGRPDRDQFLRWALARLPSDPGLPEAERAGCEAQILARLGDAGEARARMREALALEPGQGAWRAEFVGWLLDAGQFDEAHEQALLGVNLDPADRDARRALELATDALSRGAR